MNLAVDGHIDRLREKPASSASISRVTIGRVLLVVIALAAFLTTLGFARSIGLSTAQPTQRMQYHALPVAISQLYHGRAHDYTAHWQIAMAFQAPGGTVQEQIIRSVTQTLPANPQTYFWTADDRGLSDFVYGAFLIFGPSVPSLFYFWFVLLGASLCTALIVYRMDPWSLALIASAVIAIGLIVPIYARANGGAAIHISESRMFDVLGCIAFLHLLLSIFRPVGSPLWLHAGALLCQAGLLGFLLHTRSTLTWIFLAVIIISLVVTASRWLQRRPARERLQSLAPAALVVTAWCAVLGYQITMLHPAYRTEIGPRTVWHNALIGLAASPAFARQLLLPDFDDALATDAVLRDMAQRQDPRLGPGWTRENIMNSLGSHSRFDWVTYEAVARSLVLRTLAADPMATLQLIFWEKPRRVFGELFCHSLRPVPSCGKNMGVRDYLRPTRQSGLLSAFWMVFAGAVGAALAMATTGQRLSKDESRSAVRTYVQTALLALLVSLLLSYLFYAAPTQLAGAGLILATSLYFTLAVVVAMLWPPPRPQPITSA